MSYVLDNISTQDAFVAATTLDNMEPSKKINLSVTNAAIKVSEKYALPGAGVRGNISAEGWEPEYTMLPSERSLLRTGLVGIRFRSLTPGTPAKVTCIVFPPHES